jgi:peptidoglycan/xylan/chitin deacetylase (PgdA/CDA1 family)
MDEVLAARRRRRLPARSVLLTFDDGYRDFAEHAWPILRAAGLPATLFVATGAIGRTSSPFWWDRLHAAVRRGDRRTVTTPLGPIEVASLRDRVAFRGLLERLKRLPHAQTLMVVGAVENALGDAIVDGRFIPEPGGLAPSILGADDLRTLAGDGVTLAAHTRTHPLLTRVPSAVAREEITGSCDDLGRLGVAVAPVLAYPSGAVDDRVTDLVADLGFELAFTTDRGLNRLGNTHRLRLRRFNVGAVAGPGLLAAELLWSEAAVRRQGRRPTDASPGAGPEDVL